MSSVFSAAEQAAVDARITHLLAEAPAVKPEQAAALARILGDSTTVAAQQLAAEQAFPPVASHNGEPSTDLLRAAAQGIAARLHREERYTHVACTSGCLALTVTPYLFDEQGRMDETALWGLVRILEHTIERGPRHNLTSWVVGA